jgi:precorrin-4 methylase
MSHGAWQRGALALAALALALTWAAPAGAWGRGTFYVIGTGPAGPRTCTVEALETMARMDAVVASDKHARLFAEHLGDIPVVLDPWRGLWDYRGKRYAELDRRELAEFKQERFRVRDRNVARIKELMAQGKDVALLDSGNPCLFGPSHWYLEQFAPQEVVVIPGMGCDAAALAALKASAIPAHGARMVVQTAPFFLWDRAPRPGMGFDPDSPEGQEALADVARHQHTLILYMALKEPVKLFQALGRHLPADMPAACVYWAGHPDKQRVVRGTVGDLGPKLAADPERFMGLVLVGRFLEGKPYQEAMRRHQRGLRAQDKK